MIKDEIDHNGAYLCVHKLLELQYLRHCGLKLVCEDQKKCFTNRQKWRRFVLLTFINPKIGYHVKTADIFCFVDFETQSRRGSRSAILTSYDQSRLEIGHFNVSIPTPEGNCQIGRFDEIPNSSDDQMSTRGHLQCCTSIRPNFLNLNFSICISFNVFPVKCSYYREQSLNHLSASLSVLYRQQINIPVPANQGPPKIISINCRAGPYTRRFRIVTFVFDEDRETCIILRETKSRSVYRYYPNIRSSCFISKNCIFQSTSIIFILLIRSNIELNPGPPKIISVNCRGLSSRVKLLSSIGKLRKECEKNESAIIFLQETHLDDCQLISEIWLGTQIIKSYYSRAQRGTLIILKGEFKINSERNIK